MSDPTTTVASPSWRVRVLTRLTWRRSRSWPATAAEPSTPTGTISVGSSSGPATAEWHHWRRPEATSSSIECRWSSEAWRPRRSIGGCPRCVATTDSPTSTVASPPAPPNTSAAPRSPRPRGTGWTAPSSAPSCSPLSGTTRCTPHWLCCLASTACGCPKRAGANIEDLAIQRGRRTLAIVGKGNKPAVIPLVPRTARTVDLAVGERHEGPILCRRDGQRLDRRTAHRWVRSIGRRAGLGVVHPHMLRAGFIMAALDVGVPLRDVQFAARHADPRTTTICDRRRENFDRHAAYVVVAFVAGG